MKILVKQLQYKITDLNVSDERHVKAYKQKKEKNVSKKIISHINISMTGCHFLVKWGRFPTPRLQQSFHKHQTG